MLARNLAATVTLIFATPPAVLGIVDALGPSQCDLAGDDLHICSDNIDGDPLEWYGIAVTLLAGGGLVTISAHRYELARTRRDGK